MPGWDEALLIWLNHLIGSNQGAFFSTLVLADRPSLVISAVALVTLWFATDTWIGSHPTQRAIRQQVLLIVFSMVMAFVFAQFLAGALFRPRPLVALPLLIPIETSIWADIAARLRDSSSFPSDHAAFWFALVAGLFHYNRKVGLVAGLISLFFGACRVAVGYIYPSDIIAGAMLGSLTFLAVLAVRQRLVWVINPVLELFEALPALAYPLGLLILFDMTQRLAWLFGLLTMLLGLRISS